jgi:hypothetical protein
VNTFNKEQHGNAALFVFRNALIEVAIASQFTSYSIFTINSFLSFLNSFSLLFLSWSIADSFGASIKNNEQKDILDASFIDSGY